MQMLWQQVQGRWALVLVETPSMTTLVITTGRKSQHSVWKELSPWKHESDNPFQPTPFCGRQKKLFKHEKNMSKHLWSLMPLCQKSPPEPGQNYARNGRRTGRRRILFVLSKPVSFMDHFCGKLLVDQSQVLRDLMCVFTWPRMMHRLLN